MKTNVNNVNRNHSLQCSSCGDDLDGEEIESPRKDKDGDIICDKCFEDKYMYRCPICEELFEEDLEAKISPKYILISENVGDYVGLDAGVYEIIDYPFFADGIIEMHIYKDAVKRICDIPSDIVDGDTIYCDTIYYICDDCKAKLEQESHHTK